MDIPSHDAGRAMDFEPQFLHFSSIIFDLASHSRELLMPVAFGFLGAASGSWFWGIIAMIAFGFAMLRTLFRYLTLRYQVVNGELILNEGLIFKNQRTVPLSKIQNIDLTQNVLHRIFRVAEVRLETASGTEAEAVLRVLTERQIDSLRQAVYGSRNHGRKVAADSAELAPGDQPKLATPVGIRQDHDLDGAGQSSTPAFVEPKVVPLLQIPWTWLVLAGLAGNRGWLMVGVALGTFYQFDLYEKLFPKEWEQWIPIMRLRWTDLLDNWAAVLLFVLVAFGLLKVLGIIWYLYRFFGYQLGRQGNDLRVSAGLVSRYSMSVPQQRIQFISIHRPLILGWFRFVSIRIETAGGTGGGEETQENLARTWFIPVLPAAEVPRLLNEIRPGLSLSEEQIHWQGAAANTRQRLLRMAVVVSIAAIAISVYFWHVWGLLPGGLIAAHQVWFAWRKSQSLRYARTDFGVVFRSGIWYRKLSCTFFDRIQILRLSQSPFDRRWQTSTLVVDTAGAGPSDHAIEVPFLDAQFARAEFENLERAAAQHRPSWR
ncbi:MAG: PH domain-containing protein [Planctomycetaceae bacterium]|nr:PH domain-containing protein [Planctomycetaceae bacterium]